MNSGVLDYSRARPDPARIRAAGYAGVVRYLSHDPAKDITPAELTGLRAAGLPVALVWETTARRAFAGSAAGQADGLEAAARARALGWPPDRPVYLAVDDQVTPADLPTIRGYWLGAQLAGAGRPYGLYGSWLLMRSAIGWGVRWLWQTWAWSLGQDPPAGVRLYQDGAPTIIPDTDHNQVLAADWGQHPAPGPLPAAGEDGPVASYVVPDGPHQDGDGVIAVAPPLPPRQLARSEWLAAAAGGAKYAAIARADWQALAAAALAGRQFYEPHGTS